MNLEDIYNQLAYGELRHTVLGSGGIDGPEPDGLPEEALKKVFPLVKLGLTELHKRFLLRTAELTLELQTGQSDYSISKAFAQSNTRSKEAVKYIDDSITPFQDDLLKIERVYGVWDSEPYEIPLNEEDDLGAVYTTAINTLVVPTDSNLAPWLLESSTLRVVYRADHAPIPDYLASAEPLLTEIYLPNSHLEALVWYIASRATNPQGLTQEFHEGNNYAAKFEAACALLTEQNFLVNRNPANNKLTRRGFV